MESRIDSIIIGANEVVDKIYEKIGEIDNCKAVLKNLETAEVSLVMPDGNIASLSPALGTEQKAELLYNIRSMVKHNIDSAALFLEGLSSGRRVPEPELPFVTVGSSAPEYEPMMALEPEPTPEFTYQGENFPVAQEEQKKAMKAGGKPSKMTVEEVKQMLIDGYTPEDIAKHYEYKTVQTVYNFISKNKLKLDVLTAGNDKARDLTEKDIPQIRALYTNGPMNLTETAAELNTTKKKLREFCEQNHLLKIKKDW